VPNRSKARIFDDSRFLFLDPVSYIPQNQYPSVNMPVYKTLDAVPAASSAPASRFIGPHRKTAVSSGNRMHDSLLTDLALT
jgi:hypothetical protein